MKFTEQSFKKEALVLKFYQHCLQVLIQSIQRSTVIVIYFLKSGNSHQTVLMITMYELELTDVRLTPC